MAAKNDLDGHGGKDLCVEVKAGDSVWSLAQKIYGPGHEHLAAIYEENHMAPHVTARNGKRAFIAPVVKPGDKIFFPTPERVHQLEYDFFSKLDAGKETPATSSVTRASESVNGSKKTDALVIARLAEPNITAKADTGVPPESMTTIPSHVSNSIKPPLEQSAPQSTADTKTTTSADKTATHPIGDDNALNLIPTTTPDKKATNSFPVPGAAQMPAADSAKNTKPTAKIDDLARVAHVTEVCADGLIVGSIREGIKQSCEDPVGTAARVGTAVALGTAFGVATGGVGFVAEAVGAVGVGLTVVGAWDFLNPFDKRNAERNANIASCATSAWNADDRQSVENCYAPMERELGRPGFDLGIGLVGGAAGAKFGRVFMQPKITLLPPTGPKLLSGPGSDGVDTQLRVLETTLGGPSALETSHGGPKWLETFKQSPKLLEDHGAELKPSDPKPEASGQVSLRPPLPSNTEASEASQDTPKKSPDADDSAEWNNPMWASHKAKLNSRLQIGR